MLDALQPPSGPRSGDAADHGVRRDVGRLFPIPNVAGEAVPSGRLSRGTRQRITQRRAIVKSVNDAVDALNWCGGYGQGGISGSQGVCSSGGNFLGGPLLPLHAEVLGDVLARVRDRGAPPLGNLTSEEAARALLRSRFGYESETPNVAAFSPGQVSLPASLAGAPDVLEVVPKHVREMLEKVDVYMLRDKNEFLQLRDHGDVKPYMDRLLQRSPSLYRGFIRRLRSLGLLHLTLCPGEDVTVFFVRKKDGRLRMVIDARLPNQRFKDPPGVHLTTVEGFARMEVLAEMDDYADDKTVDLFLVTTDVDNCFHRLKIGRGLGEYFCLPP